MRRYDYGFKIVFFGDPLSGKEDLLRKYTKEGEHPFFRQFFRTDQKLSRSVEFFSKVVSQSNRSTLLSIWAIPIVNERFKLLWPQ